MLRASFCRLDEKPARLGSRSVVPLAFMTVAALSSLTACGTEATGSPDADTAAQIFVPTLADFDCYRKWDEFSFDSPGTSDGLTHVSGHRDVYLNRRPTTGSTSFPVGTIIVKDIQPGTTSAKTFGMAKRGGNYNSSGAPGWEWFEFDPTAPDCSPVKMWDGVTPPTGENYSLSPNGTCNDCHGAVPNDNDSVLSDMLKLVNL